MRILVIRGRNLASLYGDFELALDRGPIAEAGLFSIAGPTGAGKSTLIDALCLALYGDTPRFDERGKGVRPGRADQHEDDLVDASDRRNLLSRGTGEGFAEVDFECIDGRPWRARWEVRRARGKPEGRFQNVQMTLRALDGDEAHSGVAEVKRRVVERIGYSFDEFRRAVVLPQFEFRAFLDADLNTRAAILERVTGTEIYGQLSRAAHERAAAVRAARDGVLQRAGDVQPLPPAEREDLERRVEALLAARTAAAEATRAAEADVRWLEADEALTAEVAAAEHGVSGALDVARAAEPRRQLLADVEAVEPLRTSRADATRTASEAEAASRARDEALGALEAARTDRAARAAAQDEAKARLEAALGESERLRPELQGARALDVRREGALRALREAEAALAGARRDEKAAEDALREIERRVTGVRAQREASADWLAQRGAERALAAEWPRWKALLRDHAAAVTDLAAAGDSARTWRKALDERSARRDGLAARTAQLRSASADAGERLAEASAAGGSDDLAALAARVKLAGERRAWATSVLEAARQAQVAAGERDGAARAAEEAGAALAALAALERELADRTRLAEGRLAAAEEALERLQAALDLDDRRSELREGQPCPLCGATEHPYAHGAPGESALAAQAAAVKGEKTALAALQADARRLAARCAAEQQRQLHAAQALERQAAALAAADERYAAQRASAHDAALPPAAADALEAATACAARTSAEADVAQSAQALALERAALVERARGEAERARAALDAAERERSALEIELAHDGGLLREAEEKARAHAARRDGIETDLEPVLGFRPGWREEARARAAALLRALEAIAAAHAERARTVEEAAATLATLEAERESARARLEERARATKAAGAEVEVRRSDADALGRERALLLGGEPVADVEQAQAAAEAAARTTVESAAGRLSRAEQVLAATTARCEAAERAVLVTAEAASAAAAALAGALAARGLDRPRLEALLARGPDWVAAERRALAALEDAVKAAEATLAERRRKLEAHQATNRPAVALAEARERAASAASERERAERDHGAALLDLRRDDERRSAHAALGEELARAEAEAARWGALSDLIGSHDGRALRVFAQGLTLDALLAAANRHLSTLAPRYRLERVPRRDLDLQVVDGDLGNEVRGVNGLSGGESFLVSLALALGLASISTRRSQCRTLFIDEGFGTLDRETLEQAMAAIDQLRSGNRTVGVISHVPELHERIGVRVTVERVSAGRSRLVSPSAFASVDGREGATRRAS